MRVLDPAELARMRATQASSMMDTCVVLAYGEDGSDNYGLPEHCYTPQDPTPCGFDPGAGKEVMDGAQVVVTDARLRLSLGTAVDPRDRIRITHRFGEALATPPTFEILGEPERGPSGMVLNLRLVTDGSDQ